ncbi:hypothetical protein KKD19_00700 [Patescibacteria group bacterium]|nr:hypothetical protein [Patescibacteria group bacterium]MBU4511751.1 hypothetical protein [Patescibacteria group bacterium]MCG2693605.1 hypothetical protein [Candidatus Parcubacteria bacterium]
MKERVSPIAIFSEGMKKAEDEKKAKLMAEEKSRRYDKIETIVALAERFCKAGLQSESPPPSAAMYKCSAFDEIAKIVSGD